MARIKTRSAYIFYTAMWHSQRATARQPRAVFGSIKTALVLFSTLKASIPTFSEINQKIDERIALNSKNFWTRDSRRGYTTYRPSDGRPDQPPVLRSRQVSPSRPVYPRRSGKVISLSDGCFVSHLTLHRTLTG
jgi:hypothetical protein